MSKPVTTRRVTIRRRRPTSNIAIHTSSAIPHTTTFVTPAHTADGHVVFYKTTSGIASIAGAATLLIILIMCCVCCGGSRGHDEIVVEEVHHHH